MPTNTLNHSRNPTCYHGPLFPNNFPNEMRNLILAGKSNFMKYKWDSVSTYLVSHFVLAIVLGYMSCFAIVYELVIYLMI